MMVNGLLEREVEKMNHAKKEARHWPPNLKRLPKIKGPECYEKVG
jgi:hypothetical protein